MTKTWISIAFCVGGFVGQTVEYHRPGRLSEVCATVEPNAEWDGKQCVVATTVVRRVTQ